ncbi:hypothetical protein CEXT_445561 [Caerostris extrusa]|uniref:Uncharacterized protein n=1 Tax=Caerostris extrusa TaxID=172846 RepID=A0AAV4PNG4_CAEEX|nr:hypothetical protein CEXT_445561 [Caerostris extrusa]
MYSVRKYRLELFPFDLHGGEDRFRSVRDAEKLPSPPPHSLYRIQVAVPFKIEILNLLSRYSTANIELAKKNLVAFDLFGHFYPVTRKALIKLNLIFEI